MRRITPAGHAAVGSDLFSKIVVIVHQSGVRHLLDGDMSTGDA
jgi:hypothetical protein